MPLRGDVWFDRLFTDHARTVGRFLRRRVDPSDVEDLTADVFVIAWRRRHDVPEGAELPWLYRTAGNVVANHHRKHRAVPIADIPETTAEDSLQWPADTDDIRRIVDGLSARDRQILVLTAWEGLTGDELAAVLGIGRGGADAALSRARARLRAGWDAVLTESTAD